MTGSPPQPVPNLLAAAVRARRAALGRTLTTLAEQCGVSVGFLSQIESGRANPTLAVLVRLAEALDTELSVLLAGPPPPEPVGPPFTPAVRARPAPDTGGDRQSVREYTALGARLLRAAYVEGSPPDHTDPIDHPGEELCLVVSGRYLLCVGDQTRTLTVGDFAHYPASTAHSLTAAQPGSSALLVLATGHGG